MSGEHLRQFTRELRSGNAEPERLALYVGGLLDPALNVAYYLACLDEMADAAADTFPAGLRGDELLRALLNVFHEQMGFQGNLGNYYDPENSFLHRVLERRRGLPITLSLLYMAVGRRMGIHLEGMGFPAHFMLRYQDEAGCWLLDPFHGAIVPEANAASYLSGLFHQPVRLHSTVAEYAVSTRMLLLRLLNNLRNVYLSTNAFERTLPVLDFMVAVDPGEPELWRDRGLLHIQSGRMLDGESDLRHYFARRDRLHLFLAEPGDALPGPPGLPSLRWQGNQSPTAEERQVITVLEHIRTAVGRMN